MSITNSTLIQSIPTRGGSNCDSNCRHVRSSIRLRPLSTCSCRTYWERHQEAFNSHRTLQQAYRFQKFVLQVAKTCVAELITRELSITSGNKKRSAESRLFCKFYTYRSLPRTFSKGAVTVWVRSSPSQLLSKPSQSCPTYNQAQHQEEGSAMESSNVRVPNKLGIAQDRLIC
jgi:hypothetical protein